jgi:hypothetical protein
MPTMYDIVKVCEQQRCANSIHHSNLVTAGNDPSITKPHRYSTYIQTAKPRTKYVTSAKASLVSEGITFNSYFSPVLVSLQFTNLKEFNMPRLKIFSRINVK